MSARKNHFRKERVLITGGSGFLGINLIRHLIGRGYRNIVSLDLRRFDYPERHQVESIVGDVRDPIAVRRAVQDVDWIVHAAAALPRHPPAEIWTTDVDGTGTVLDCARSAGVGRLIFISSTAVYGVPKSVPITEETPLTGVGDYGKAKIQAEMVCHRYRDQGLCVPILRPKSFVGPERLGAFELLFDFASAGCGFPVIGPGENRYQLLDVEDLCAAIHRCANVDRERANDTFNIGAEVFGTLRNDFQAVLENAGFGKRVVSFPTWMCLPVLEVLEFLGLSPLYEWIYRTAVKDSWVSVSRATDRLGFRPQYSNQEALLRNYRWYLSHRCVGRPGLSHRVPWKHGVLDALKVVLR